MHTHTSHRKRITNHTSSNYWRAFQHPCMPLQTAQGYSPHSLALHKLHVGMHYVPASLSNCSNAAGKVGKVGILENLNEIK